MATESGQAKASANEQPVSPWAALNQLRKWDPEWAEQCVKMTANPRTDGILPIKFIELVSVGLNAARTNLNPEGTRRHIRAALAAGARNGHRHRGALRAVRRSCSFSSARP